MVKLKRELSVIDTAKKKCTSVIQIHWCVCVNCKLLYTYVHVHGKFWFLRVFHKDFAVQMTSYFFR